MKRVNDEDFIGKRFGKLIVIGRNEEETKRLNEVVWNCKCDCGNEPKISRRKLLRGERTSCGHCLERRFDPGTIFGNIKVICKDKEATKLRNRTTYSCECLICGYKMKCAPNELLEGKSCANCKKNNYIDEILGKKFGMLTAVKYDYTRSQTMHTTVYECKCDCGNTVYCTSSNLKSGNSTSCGCKRKMFAKSQIKDEVGKTYGKLTVLELDRDQSDKFGETIWKCVCECGKTVPVRGSSLRNGQTTSCGSCAKIDDLTGQIFGRLTVEKFERVEPGVGAMWRCKCLCGNETIVSAKSLKCGNTKSCGCLAKDKLKARGTHGEYYNEIKGKYYGIIERCYNKNNPQYHNYGGRGIKVCDRWLGENGLNNFYNDVVNGYHPGLTLDRKEVNENYSPENCRWLTRKEQNYNKRNNVYVDYYGKRICLAELAENFSKINGLTSSAMSARINEGYTIDEALNKPIDILAKKDTYFKQHPIHSRPFMYKYELDAMDLFAEDRIYEKPDPMSILKNAPTAKDYWRRKD